MKEILVKTYPAALSRFGLGTASFGLKGLTGEPLAQAYAILDKYYALGGRLLDTANLYGRWGVDKTNASEKIIGQWLRERQVTDMTVLTKACHHDMSTPHISRVSKADLLQDVDESRATLGMDTLDMLLLHRDNPKLDVREIVDFCMPLVESGKVRRFGFSNYTAARVQAAIEYLGADWSKYFAGVSNEQSLAMDGADNYAPGDGMVPVDAALRQLQVQYPFPIMPFSSIAHGFFEKLRRGGAVYDGAWHNTDGLTRDRAWLTDANGRMYNRLCALSAETGFSVTALSLAYLLAQPDTIPMASASRVEQLEELDKVTEIDWDILLLN